MRSLLTAFKDFLSALEQFPEYIPGLEAAAAVLILALPVYGGLWYFLHRRGYRYTLRLQAAVLGVFILFAGLAFAVGSPLAAQIHPLIINGFLFITCLVAAYCITVLVDIFLVRHYMSRVRGIYLSPPLMKVINLAVFCLAVYPILRYVLKFNPLTLIAIPAIATAVLALALQDTLKTFIAGVGLGNLLRVGDWAVFQDKEGRVLDINWGRAVLEMWDGARWYIPNTLLLAQPFVTFSAHRAHRMTLKAGLSYSAAPERVKQAMERSARDLPGVAKFPQPAAQVLNMGESSIVYALYYWVEDYGRRFDVQDQLATRLWDAFRQEGFELPFPFPARSIGTAAGRKPSIHRRGQPS